MTNQITVGLISRMMEIDIPYYSEWFEYYDKLDIDSFYIIIHDVKNFDLKNILKYYPEKKIKSIVYMDAYKHHSANDSLFCKSFTITDDYLLNIDSDEFLYLKGMNIKQFILSNSQYNYFKFNWLMVPSFYNYSNSLSELFNNNEKKYFLNQYKSMIKIKDFNGYTLTPHDFIIPKPEQSKIKLYSNFNNFFIIHFTFRGKYDAYLKLKYQFLMNKTPENLNYNNSIFDPKIKLLLGKDIPERFIIYIGEIFNKNENIKINDLLNLESKTEIDYLNKLIDKNEYDEFCVKLYKFLEYNIFNDVEIIFAPKAFLNSYFKNNFGNKTFFF
jgi:hypothetical protein